MCKDITQFDTYRPTPDWMTSLDERILEILAIEGNMTPLALSNESLPNRIGTTEPDLQDRCCTLYHFGYLSRTDDIFSINPSGFQFLSRLF